MEKNPITITLETARCLCEYIGSLPHMNILHNPILAKYEQEVYPQLIQQSNQNQNSMESQVSDAEQKPFTFGQKRVGISFNPSGNPNVDQCKQLAADAIDHLKWLSDESSNQEAKRCFAEAMTLFESAAMWGVKAITKPN